MKGGIAVKSSKLIKLKRTLILSSVYMLLSAILLLSISTAKYADAHLAYTSYGAASFNSVILGDCTDGTITAFGKTLCADECRPGMEYSEEAEDNTSKSIPFSIANGTSAENASEASVSYTIRLRTTRNLPLRFSLAGLTAAAEGDDMEQTLYSADEPVLVKEANQAGAAGTLSWYEWTFMKDTEEAIFSLDGGGISINNHKLIVEWPITETEDGATPDNSADYMKEIDLIEVIVTVSSKNSIGIEHKPINVPVSELYGKGIIILDPDTDADADDTEYPFHYSYPLDLRAFHAVTEGGEDDSYNIDPEDTDNKVYDFTVSNGVGVGMAQVGRYTDYVIEVKTPYTVADTDQNTKPTKDFEYSLYQYDRAAKVYICATTLYPTELRLYNEQVNSPDYGKYRTVSNPTPNELAEWTAEKSPMRLYRVYSFAGNEQRPFHLINKMADNEGNYTDRAASHDFRLVLMNENGEIDPATAFENKLEIIVKASQTNGDGSSSPEPDGGSGSGTDQTPDGGTGGGSE